MAIAVGVLGVFGLHAPVFLSGFKRIPGDEGDARAFVYLAEHWYQAFRGHADLLSPGMFYPIRGTLGYTDPIPAHAIPFSMLRLGGLDMFTALTVTVVFFSLLNYVACFFLLNKALRLNAAASSVGAMFFAFNSPRFSHAGHFNLLAAFFLPLGIAFVVQLARDAPRLTQRRTFVLLSGAALCFDAQLLTSLYLGWFFFLWALILLVLMLVVPSSRRFLYVTTRGMWPAIIGGATVFLLGLIPIAAIYLPVSRAVGPRPYVIVRNLIPDGWSLLRMGSDNYVWGDAATALAKVHPLASTELNIGIGLAASVAWLALTAWALVTIKRSLSARTADHETNWDLILSLTILATTAFYMIGMKYENESSPWRFVYLLVPGAKGLRAGARYVMFLALPMSIAFAVFLHTGMRRLSLQRDSRRRRLLTAGAFAVVAFGVWEQFAWTPSISSTAELARLQRLAGYLPPDCAAFYVAAPDHRQPIKHEYQIDAMLISILASVPTLNGYSGHVPPGWSLREVETPDYEDRVAKWIATNKVKGTVCRLEIADS